MTRPSDATTLNHDVLMHHSELYRAIVRQSAYAVRIVKSILFSLSLSGSSGLSYTRMCDRLAMCVQYELAENNVSSSRHEVIGCLDSERTVLTRLFSTTVSNYRS